MRPLDSLTIARESIIEAAQRTMRRHMQETYIEERDGARLSKQREAVLDLMRGPFRFLKLLLEPADLFQQGADHSGIRPNLGFVGRFNAVELLFVHGRCSWQW